jgi:hypothetical protein
MRILFISYYFEPDLSVGSFKNTALFKALLERLGEMDFIHVITTQPSRYKSYKVESEEIETGANYRIDRIRVPEHNGSFLSQIKSFYAFRKKALKIVKREEFDIVYASSSRLFTALLGKRIAVKKDAFLYLDIRDIFVDTIKDLFKTRKLIQIPLITCLKPLERYIFSNADHINLVSGGFSSYFSKYVKPKYTYFTNGIDDVFLSADTTPRSASDKIVITYAGNIGSGQGLEKIVPGASERLGKNYLFRIIGDGGTKRLLEKAIKEANVAERVELINPVSREKLIDYYNESDFLFLHLNDFNAFKKVLPSKIFEYTVFNKPIIAGVGGYAQQFIKDNITNCIVFNPTDIDTFVHQLLSFDRNRKVDNKSFIHQYVRNNIMREMSDSIISLCNRS